MSGGPVFLGYGGLLGNAKPVDMKQLGQALWDTNLNAPIRGAYNLMNASPYALYADTGAAGQQAVANSTDAASGVTLADQFIPRPLNSIGMGGNPEKFRAYKGMHGVTDAGNIVDPALGRGQHSWDKGAVKNAGFFASNPDVASHFADALSRDGKTVFPVDVEFSNPLVIDGKGKHASEFQFGKNKSLWDSYFSSPEFDQYDGVILKNVKDAGGLTDIYVPKASVQISSWLKSGGI